MFSNSLTKFAIVAIAAIASLAVLASDANARAGTGGSVGSRGTRTYTAPPGTNTAPRVAAPIDKSITQAGKSTVGTAAGGFASRFGGWRSILLGGLIGAGLASLFGFGALANVLGFVLQVALIGGIVWLVMSYFRNRSAQPAMARAGASESRPQQSDSYRQVTSMMGGGGGPALTIGPEDYDAFERLLGEIQLAYGRNDVKALGDMVTPEMLSYFSEELDANTRKGLRNEVSEPKLLQGDLAEAWREDSGEYATVAMRYSIKDATVDASSGRVVSGSLSEPQEVTELWTFRRPLNGSARQWELSAIQQAGEQVRLAS
jgi:predicted lipid-binding transport protein (Tim44 family)